MKYLFDEDTEAEVESRHSSRGRAGSAGSQDTEITLGMRSILGIFFGLILICGVFFGLGYSVGRGSSSHASTIAAGAADAADPSATPDSHLPKPSATESLTAADTATSASAPESDDLGNSAPATESASEPGRSGGTSADSASLISAVAPVPATQAEPKPAAAARPAASSPAAGAPAAVVPVSASAAGGKTFMVQIAAVRLAEDANVLVSALDKHGYSAVIRHEPQDQWLHVQVGPYASRAAANAMRAKLLSDGYNAVVK